MNTKLHPRKLEFVMVRIAANQGHQPTLIAEAVRLHNELRQARHNRRATDHTIQGWDVVRS